MAANPKSAITPAGSRALAAPADTNPLASALAGYDPKTVNLCTPITVLDRVPAMHRVSVRVVQIDAASETYPIPGGDKVGLGKTALDKIAAAAGVNWVPERCGQIDSYRDPHRVTYRAVATIQDFDGRRRVVFAEKEIDLRGEPDWPLDQLGVDTREFVRVADAKAAFHMDVPPGARASRCRDCGQDVFWVETRSGKKMPLDASGDSHFATCPVKAATKLPAGWERVYQQRSNIHSLAESKAKLRCIRAAIGIPTSMTPEQAAKPFVVPALVPDLDTSDPEIRRMLAASLIGAEAALYGPREVPRAALQAPARDEEPAIDVSEMAVDEPAPDPSVGTPADPDPWPADAPANLDACPLPLSDEAIFSVPANDEARVKGLSMINTVFEQLVAARGATEARAIGAKVAGGLDPVATPMAELRAVWQALRAELAGGAR